jgi:prolipoprotein diacylglyceryltransferase
MHLNCSSRTPFLAIFGGVGFTVAVITTSFIASKSQLGLPLVFFLAFTSYASFFLQAVITHIITHKESHVLYRHLILSMLFATIPAIILNKPILACLDLYLIGFGIFHSFGRIGCLLGGCCFGRPAQKGLIYTNSYAKAGFPRYLLNRPLLPVQLIESGFLALLSITCITLYALHLPNGTILVIYLSSYAIFRFYIEFVRADPDRLFFGFFSEAQWTSLCILIVLAVLQFTNTIPLQLSLVFAFIPVAASMYWLHRRRNKSPNADLEHPVHLHNLLTMVEAGIADNSQGDQLPVGRLSVCKVRMTMSTLYEKKRSGYHLAFSVPIEEGREDRIKKAFQLIHQHRFASCDYQLIADRNRVMHFHVFTDKIIAHEPSK